MQPCDRSSSMICRWPFQIARSSAVYPSYSIREVSVNNGTAAPQFSGQAPVINRRTSVSAMTSAPHCSSIITICVLPVSAAQCSMLNPPLCRAIPRDRGSQR